MNESVADELVKTVDAAAARLRELADQQVSRKPAPDRWCVKEILGHLVDSAVNNHHRFVRAQEVGSLEFPKYFQDSWVSRQGYSDSDWPPLVELWRLYNRHLAHVVRRVPAAKLVVVCRIGPYEPVTLGYLIEDYLVHLQHHLRQIEERLRE